MTDRSTPYYVHNTEGPEAEWHTVEDHARGVAERAAGFLQDFGLGEMARAWGLLHDIGMVTREFKNVLAGSPRRFDHSAPGAGIALERYRRLGRILAPGIAGHHAGLSDWDTLRARRQAPFDDAGKHQHNEDTEESHRQDIPARKKEELPRRKLADLESVIRERPTDEPTTGATKRRHDSSTDTPGSRPPPSTARPSRDTRRTAPVVNHLDRGHPRGVAAPRRNARRRTAAHRSRSRARLHPMRCMAHRRRRAQPRGLRGLLTRFR